MKDTLKTITRNIIIKKSDSEDAPIKTFKAPTMAIQCDSCSKLFKEGDCFKCAECSNFDLCESCFNS